MANLPPLPALQHERATGDTGHPVPLDCGDVPLRSPSSADAPPPPPPPPSPLDAAGGMVGGGADGSGGDGDGTAVAVRQLAWLIGVLGLAAQV